MRVKLQYGIYSFALIFVTSLITKYLVNEGLIPFYDILEKPVGTPENNYFRYIWNTLYVLMFLGFYTALLTPQRYEQFYDLNTLFILQLFLQIVWTFSFFYIQQIGVSAVVIVLLDIVAALLMHTLFFINLWSFFLFLPFLIWILFATYLNVFIAFLN